MAKPFHLVIEKQSKNWDRVQGFDKRLQAATEAALAALPEALLPVAAKAQATVLLTSDKEVQQLNREFRKVDKPTNVLSFPQFDRVELRRAAKCLGGVYVGDIAVAYGTVVKEAKAEGKEVLDHLTHLVIHGWLHLFGYDHDTSGKAAHMERLEKEIMASLGLPDPYEAQPKETRGSTKRKK
ncbi:MAG: rRNA maturation RNase YbeY [Bdellovibrionales bacterium]